MLERVIERLLYGSRWLLAPVYLGMSLALMALAIVFFKDVWYLFAHLMAMSESDVMLKVLTMIDIVLVASLVIMVMFAGYENFVSRIDIREGDDQLNWMGKLDAGTLKLKVAASIVAISSIHLLKIFMDVENIPNDKLAWYVVIHLTFVVSALLMGVLEKLVLVDHGDADTDGKKH